MARATIHKYGLLLGLFFLAVACGKQEDTPPVSLSNDRPQPASGKNAGVRSLKIAISAMWSPRRSMQDYEQLVRHIGRKMGMPSEMILRPTYSETVSLLRTGEVDAVLMCSGPFVDARREFGAEALAIPRVDGLTTYRSYIIVRKESPFRSMEDLKGKVFALTDPLSNTGRLYPAYLAARAGARLEDYFGRTFYTGGHDNSVEAVADGIADGAAVDSMIWESLAKSGAGPVSRTRVLLRSPPFGIPPVVVGPRLAEPVKRRLRQAFLEMHRDPEGAAVLSQLGIERFLDPSDAAYDEIRRMKAAVRRAGRAP